tara:strand:- start:515 stop:1438 length:924 start_codon:yes stop_codon:yes gene_type:complete
MNILLLMNLNTKHFESSFNETIDEFILKIDDFPEINFPKNDLYSAISSNSEWLRSAHLSSNFHEPGMLKALIHIKKEGFKIESIVDIGSFYGYFSKVSESIFPNARIYAVEPNYDSFKILVENSKYNKNKVNNIQCNFLAISNDNQTNYKIFYGFDFLKLSIANLLNFGARNFIKFLLRKSKSPFLKIWKLKEESLENFCKTRDMTPDLIKIDVEGRQALILPPAYEYILEAKPIILLEFDSLEKLEPFNTSNESVVRPLLENGYRLYWGDHRKQKCEFKEVKLVDLDQEKIDIEKDSLGILIPDIR